MVKPIAINSFAAWVLAARFKTLGAIICPIMLGSALAIAKGKFSFFIFFFTFVSAGLLQILANVINDYGDFIKGSDGHDRLGPPRALQMGIITKSAMVKGIFCIIFLTFLSGLPLVIKGGAIIFCLGILGVLLCMAYTLGKKPLAYRGFVEIIVFFVFGPLAVLSCYYLQTLSFSNEAFFISLTPGFLATALLLTNNVRDHKEDKKNQKFTTAVRLGENFSRKAIIVFIFLSAVGPISLFFFSYPPFILLSLAALFPAIKHINIVLYKPISSEFNLMLAGIGKSLYLTGIVLSLIIVLQPFLFT